jgi:iron complex transport system ATP-binding protein
MLIAAKELTLSYNGHAVVQDFNLSIPRQTMVGLVGPNGSGKTTILRALAGLIEPVLGHAFVNGMQACQLDKRMRARQIGWVPQQEIAAWPLTVYEVVRLGRAPHRGWLMPYTNEDKNIIERALTRADLLTLKSRPVDKLSGGELQRVLIARVLAQEPEVLLLDEPTANLDIHHQVQVLDLVRDLVQEKSLSVVMAIHDLSLAARYCDQLVLLHKGREVSTGKPEEVLTPNNLREVFGVKARLYRDPWGAWAVSVSKNGQDGS